MVSAAGKIISQQPLELVLKRTIIDENHYISLRGRPRFKPVKTLPGIESMAEEVERRPLSEYAALAEAG